MSVSPAGVAARVAQLAWHCCRPQCSDALTKASCSAVAVHAVLHYTAMYVYIMLAAHTAAALAWGVALLAWWCGRCSVAGQVSHFNLRGYKLDATRYEWQIHARAYNAGCNAFVEGVLLVDACEVHRRGWLAGWARARSSSRGVPPPPHCSIPGHGWATSSAAIACMRTLLRPALHTGGPRGKAWHPAATGGGGATASEVIPLLEHCLRCLNLQRSSTVPVASIIYPPQPHSPASSRAPGSSAFSGRNTWNSACLPSPACRRVMLGLSRTLFPTMT